MAARIPPRWAKVDGVKPSNTQALLLGSGFRGFPDCDSTTRDVSQCKFPLVVSEVVPKKFALALGNLLHPGRNPTGLVRPSQLLESAGNEQGNVDEALALTRRLLEMHILELQNFTHECGVTACSREDLQSEKSMQRADK